MSSFLTSAAASPLTHFIRADYVPRADPPRRTSVAPGKAIYQSSVYDVAVELAAECRVEAVWDIGCGNGDKLAKFPEGLPVTGFDLPHNVAVCRERYPQHKFWEMDVGKPFVRPYTTCRTLIVCADVVEHLQNPEPLLWWLSDLDRADKHVATVLISTPDRNLCRGEEHLGPPPNPEHVREWTIYEFARLLQHHRIPARLGLVRSTPHGSCHTILAVT